MTEWNNCWIIYPSINQIHLTTRSDNQIVNIFRYFCLGHLIQHAKGLKYNLKICHSNSKCSVYLQFFFFFFAPLLEVYPKGKLTMYPKREEKKKGLLLNDVYVVRSFWQWWKWKRSSYAAYCMEKQNELHDQQVYRSFSW